MTNQTNTELLYSVSELINYGYVFETPEGEKLKRATAIVEQIRLGTKLTLIPESTGAKLYEYFRLQIEKRHKKGNLIILIPDSPHSWFVKKWLENPDRDLNFVSVFKSMYDHKEKEEEDKR